MAAGRLIIPGWMPALTSDGDPIPNVSVSFYVPDTSEVLAVVYSDEGLSTPLANPVYANSSGRFPAIWADTASVFDASVEAPFGPPGQPFTFTQLVPSVSADLAASGIAEAAAMSAEDNAAVAQVALDDIETILLTQPESVAIAGRAKIDGSNIINDVTFKDNIEAGEKFLPALPSIIGWRRRAVAQWLGDNRKLSTDFNGVYLDDSTDSTDGLTNAFNSGFQIVLPTQGVSACGGTIFVEKDKVKISCDVSQRTPGSNDYPRTAGIRLTTGGTPPTGGDPTTAIFKPLIHFLDETCVVENVLLWASGILQYQTAILAKKPYAVGYTREAASDLLVTGARLTGFQRGIENWGWGCEIDRLFAGQVRDVVTVEFPAPGTFVDDGGGQGIGGGFRQTFVSRVHAHACRRVLVNEGSQRLRINGLQLMGVEADTGATAFDGVIIGGVINGCNLHNMQNSDDDVGNKRSGLQIRDGSKDFIVDNFSANGRVDTGIDYQPDSGIEIFGEVSGGNFGAINIGYTKRAAVSFKDAGNKQVHFAQLNIRESCSNNSIGGISRNVIESEGGTVQFSYGQITVNNSARAFDSGTAVFGTNGVGGSTMTINGSRVPIGSYPVPVKQANVVFNDQPLRLLNSLPMNVDVSSVPGLEFNGGIFSLSRQGIGFKLQRIGAGDVFQINQDQVQQGMFSVGTFGLRLVTPSGLKVKFPGPFVDNAAATAGGVNVGEWYDNSTTNVLTKRT